MKQPETLLEFVPGNIGVSPLLPSSAETDAAGIAIMEQSERETAGDAVPHVALVLFVTISGTLTLAWTAFLCWLVLKAASSLL
jgi:hypothetical protein